MYLRVGGVGAVGGGCRAYRLLQPLQQCGACSRPMLPLSLRLTLAVHLPLSLVHRPCPSPHPYSCRRVGSSGRRGRLQQAGGRGRRRDRRRQRRGRA